MDTAKRPPARPCWLARTLVGLAGATLLIASQPSHADEFRTVLGAGIGAAAGAVIGDSIGGPTGAVLGAGAGGLIGAQVAQGTGWQRVSPPAPPPGAIYYPRPTVYVPPVAPPVVVAQPVYPPYPGYGHRHHHHHGHHHGPWWEERAEPPWDSRRYGDWR